jgi:DNA-binding response OmpR family regulator
MTMSIARVLVVEDEPLIRIFIMDSLEDAGFAVEEAGSASEAMTKLESMQAACAAVIVDVGLPDRPGDILAAELRTAWPELPIIIASGHDKNEFARHFTADRFVGVLGKPYDSKMLLDTLRSLGVTASR